jgi:hypothetical protein
MDVRPTGSSAAPTAALDALQRVHAGAATDDSEDSQTAGYMFGDARKHSGGHHSSEEGSEPGDDALAIEVTVELSAESLAEHPTMIIALDATPDLSTQVLESLPPTGERHIDIEA